MKDSIYLTYFIFITTKNPLQRQAVIHSGKEAAGIAQLVQ
jgi:hypothetical protein